MLKLFASNTSRIMYNIKHYLQATVAVAKALRAKTLRLVGTCTQALQEATKISRRLAIPVTDVHLIEEDALLTSDGGVFKDLLGLPVS